MATLPKSRPLSDEEIKRYRSLMIARAIQVYPAKPVYVPRSRTAKRTIYFTVMTLFYAFGAGVILATLYALLDLAAFLIGK